MNEIDINNMMERIIESEKLNSKNCKCLRCYKTWKSKTKSGKPKLCPFCKSWQWNIPRQSEMVNYLSKIFK